MKHKFISAAVTTDATLGPRQIRVRASSETKDRVGDVLVAKGCVTRGGSVPVLLDHRAEIGSIVGRAEIKVLGDEVVALVTFLPEGQNEKADDCCAKYKAGFATDVSVGFDPVDYQLKSDGVLYEKWELLELSCVVAGCNPEAVVTGKALKSDGENWKCGASLNLPLDMGSAWDGQEAEKSIFEKAGFDGEDPNASFARKGFLAYDAGAPEKKGSYKLSFATMKDGRLTVSAAGIRAAAARLSQADIPDAVAEKARAVIDHYEAKMNDAKAARVAEIKTAIVSKGIGAVGSLCWLADELGYQQFNADWEREMEGDDSNVPEMLADVFDLLGAAIQAMAKEEIEEMAATMRRDGKSFGAAVLKAKGAARSKGGTMASNIFQGAVDGHKTAATAHDDLISAHEAAIKQHKAARAAHEDAATALMNVGDSDGGESHEGVAAAEKSLKTAHDGLGAAHGEMKAGHQALKAAHGDIAKCFKGISDKIDPEGTGLADTGKSVAARTRELEIMRLGADLA